MILLISFLLSNLFSQGEVAYKPNEEFQLELDYKFKQRPASDISTFESEGNREEHDKAKYGGGPLPYLVLHMTILKLAGEEVRMRGVNGAGDVLISRKVEVGKPFAIDLGFTVDMKDRVSPHTYTLYFLSAKKTEISRIYLYVEEDGTFLVNGERRGKF